MPVLATVNVPLLTVVLELKVVTEEALIDKPFVPNDKVKVPPAPTN